MKKYFLISAVVLITSCGGGSGSSSPDVSSISTSTSSSVINATSSSVSSSSLSLSSSSTSSNSFSSVLISSSSSVLISSSSSVLISSSSSVSSGSVAGPVGIKQIIAGPNVVPPGFDSGFVFAKVLPPSIGRNGHIAFYGLADVSQEATSQRSAAVWLGRAANLQPVLLEGNSINGIPAPMVFGPSDPSNPPAPGVPIVSSSGKLAIQIELKNGVLGATAIVVHADGVTTNVVYEGQAAVGLPNGVTIRLASSSYALSEAGVVYRAQLSTGKSGIWYWDFQTTHLLAVSGESSSAYPDCPFTSLFYGDPLINDKGDIVFAQNIERVTWSCPNMALFKWKAGDLQVLADNTMVMSGTLGTTFEVVALNSSAPDTVSYLLDDAGGVAFGAIMKEGGDRYRARWYKTDDGALQLVTVAGEKLPPDFVQTLTGDYATVTGLSTSGHLISSFDFSPSSGTRLPFILRGQPRLNIPYTSLSVLDNSQLELVYSPFSSWTALGSYSSRLFRLASNGDVLIHTNTGIWAIPVTGSAIHIADESPFYYSGAWYDLIFANHDGIRRAYSFGSGLAAEHSDVREIVSCLGYAHKSCTFIQSITY